MSETCLVLRTCAAHMTSAFGFVWPESGPVEAPDWEPTPECGHGLHGLLWGEGDGAVLNWAADARWLAVEVATADIVDLDGKCKFPRGVVVHCGDRFSATDYIAQHGGAGRAIVGGTATAGRRGSATAGDYGTATAGRKGTATAGYYGTATAGREGSAMAGDYGSATAGFRGTATAGREGSATAGYKGSATAGDYGTATAGFCGSATAGDYGTATAGYHGTATAGDGGTATAGDYGSAVAGVGGTATAGYGSTIVFARFDGAHVGYIGENGLKPNTPYRMDGNGKFEEVQR